MGAVSEQCNRMSEALRPRISSTSPPSAGDPLPANCELIEVRVSELKQLFNAIDPSPFREREPRSRCRGHSSPTGRKRLHRQQTSVCGLPGPARRPAERTSRTPGSYSRVLPSPRGTFETPAARALSPWPDKPGHWPMRTRCLVGRRKSRRGILQQSHRRDSQGRFADRRVSRHVEAHGNLSLRLVADPRGSDARRQTERDACADLVQTGWQRRRVAVGLAGRAVSGAVHSEPIESPKADRL